MNRSPRSDAVPFSRPLDLSSVGEDGLSVTVTARDAERAALARLNGLVAIDRLEAALVVSREGRWGARVRGRLEAVVQQTCVVTLDVFEAEIDESVDVEFRPESEIAALEAQRARAKETDAPLEDLPDPIVGGRIDLGVLASEFLSLALDPYPRKPGVAYAEPASTPEDRAQDSPFAVLSRLKQ